jgi:hypothetical protein
VESCRYPASPNTGGNSGGDGDLHACVLDLLNRITLLTKVARAGSPADPMRRRPQRRHGRRAATVKHREQ